MRFYSFIFFVKKEKVRELSCSRKPGLNKQGQARARSQSGAELGSLADPLRAASRAAKAAVSAGFQSNNAAVIRARSGVRAGARSSKVQGLKGRTRKK